MQPDPFYQTLPTGAILPAAVQQLHCNPGLYRGRCSVERGRGWLNALFLRLGRFPSCAEDISVQVNIDHIGQEWTWDRDFAGHTTRSRLTYDQDTKGVREKLGWLTLWLTTEVTNGCMLIHIRRLTILGVPCPAFLLPKSSTVEWQDENGRFQFDVSAEMPVLRRLIRYCGWLVPVHEVGYVD